MPTIVEDGVIAAVLQNMLQSHNMTVRQLAEQVGIPEQTLYSMVKMRTNRADIATLHTIAEYFGEDITVFLGPKLHRKRRRLSVTQEKLLDMTDILSDEGREKVLDYATDISYRYSRSSGGKEAP